MLIYCIEDINDLKYVGKTNYPLNKRFNNHIYDKYDKKKKSHCTSIKIHLEHSIIYILEECDDKDSKEREKYWINKLDTVNNTNKYNGRNPNYHKEYRQKNKDKLKQINKISNDKFRELNPDYNRIWSSKKWYCDICDCEYNRSSKRLHLLSKKHINRRSPQSDSQELSV